MTHKDPKARAEVRYRINLDHYQADAIEALARLHRKQSATYLKEIIRAFLDSHNETFASDQDSIIRRQA